MLQSVQQSRKFDLNYHGDIFVTQTNTGTMVKCVPQKQMVGVRSYPSRELFILFSGFVILVLFRDVLNFKFL